MVIKITETKADGTEKITQPDPKAPFKKIRLKDRPMSERQEVLKKLAAGMK